MRGSHVAPPDDRVPVTSYIPYVFGGVMLAAAMGFAGHQFGQDADAHISAASIDGGTIGSATRSRVLAKGPLLNEAVLEDIVPTFDFVQAPEVMSTAKADYIDDNPVVFEDPELPVDQPKADKEKLAKLVAVLAKPPIPIARPKALVKITAASAEPWKLEQTFKLKRVEKQQVVVKRRVRLAEENCLARAVYFEARSESELGQLAVAKVILNRVKDPAFPKSICGVVYQGAHRSNSCQFSFACDGSADDPKSVEAWARSKRIAQRALNGDHAVRVMGAATFYHADYVRPRWAKSMRRLIKIGRHIFYSDS